MNIFDSLRRLFGFEQVKGAVVTRWRMKRNRPKPAPPEKANIVNDKTIEYVISDPSTPELVKHVMPPQYSNQPAILVNGYRGGGFGRQTMEGQAANCFVTVVGTIDFFNNHTSQRIPKWPGTSTLHILPRAGVELNAYYDRRSLRFFYMNSPKIGGAVYLCDSSDIVAHELGHAILDAYRPDTWSVPFLEVAAFHEAFADFTAMMHVLTYDEAVEFIIHQTGGDLMKTNAMSKLAEQLGAAIYKATGGKTSPDALRHAINDFKYVDPATLPEDSEDGELAAECHNFGRVFLGVLYELLVMVYEDLKSSGESPVEALKKARDLMTSYVLKAIQNVPLSSSFYAAMAKTLLWADVTLSDRKYHDRMQQIFMKRNLVSPQLMLLSAPKCESETGVMKSQKTLNVKLSDVLLRVQSDDNPLYDVELEIPTEQTYLYDNDKMLYDSILTTDEEALMAAQAMINHLHVTGGVSDDPNSKYGVEDGKLIRRRT